MDRRKRVALGVGLCSATALSVVVDKTPLAGRTSIWLPVLAAVFVFMWTPGTGASRLQSPTATRWGVAIFTCLGIMATAGALSHTTWWTALTAVLFALGAAMLWIRMIAQRRARSD